MIQNLQYDPASGLYIDPATGQRYTQDQAANLSQSQQSARNLGFSNNLLGQLASYGQQYQQANTGLTRLGNQEDAVIAGRGPSVAAGQLEQGLNQIQQAQQSAASGSTGVNAAIARQAAMQNTAAAQAQTNQQAALLRANEVAAARAAKAQILGQQASGAANMYGTNLTGGLNASGQAAGSEANAAGIQQQRDTANKQLLGNVVGGAGTVGAAVASDKNEKKDIVPVSSDAMKDFFDKIATYTYKYKNSGKSTTFPEPPGKRIGVMAQDMEKSKLGKDAVVKKDGTLGLDLANLSGIIVSALKYLNDSKQDKAKKT